MKTMIHKLTSIKTMVLGAVALSIFAVSCKKDTLESTTDKPDATAIAELFDKLDPEMQSFTIDPSQPNTITGKDGMIIQIPANAFVDENGNPVTGSVTVSLKEILSVKDQLLSGVAAASNDSILKSGGEFFFEVTSNGEKLNLAINQSITFDIPADKVDTTMQVFIGNNGVDTAFDWVLGDTDQVIDTTTTWNAKDSVWSTDTSYVKAYELYYAMEKYVMTVRDIYNTSFYNIDYYIDYTTLINQLSCEIKVLENTEKEVVDFMVKLVYKQYSSVSYMSNQGVVSESLNLDVSDYWFGGQDVTVIVVGVGQKSKKTYFGKTSFNISAESKPSIDIIGVSDAQFSAALDNL